MTKAYTDNPAWLEIERLRSQRHLLTLRTSSAMGVEREKERRRKERQWQRWQNAMDVALDALRKEIQVSPCVDERRLPPTPPSPPCDLVMMTTPSESLPTVPLTLSLSKTDRAEDKTGRFPSRSPTVYNPSPRSRRPTLKIIIDYVYAFTFTCPAGPVWPQKRVESLSGTTLHGSSSANSCGGDHKDALAQGAESPVVSEAIEEVQESLARGPSGETTAVELRNA
ncbi:hypothetical protein FRC17_000443 [Serendipita sp. 399]|nr:hypothetical protein FRC17_000443 [Serendipita sp. 399]